MNVYRISAAGIERHQEEELNILLSGEKGFVWVDFPECDESAGQMLSEVFQIHPLALQDCRERHHFAKAYAYPDHLFVILQTPEPAHAGHIHLIDNGVHLRFEALSGAAVAAQLRLHLERLGVRGGRIVDRGV